MNSAELERFMQTIAALERQYGRVPTIREIASELGIKPTQVRSFINRNLASDKIDGTSVFHASLREELLAPLESSPVTRIVPHMETGQMKHALNQHEHLGNNGIANETELHIDQTRAEDKKIREASLFEKIKLPAENDDDYNAKLVKATKQLSIGNKVQIVVELEKEDLVQTRAAFSLINQFANDLGEIAVWKLEPKISHHRAYLWVSKAFRKKSE